MIAQTIIKTKEQILRKREEIERLKLETELLERRLKEQEKLLKEFEEAKKVFEEKAQALINSQEFDYMDIVDECRDIKLEEVAVRPKEIKSIESNQKTIKQEFKETTERLDELNRKIDTGELTKQQAAKELLDEIDQMLLTSKHNKTLGLFNNSKTMNSKLKT